MPTLESPAIRAVLLVALFAVASAPMVRTDAGPAIRASAVAAIAVLPPIALRLTEPAGVKRSSDPVTMGVPLPFLDGTKRVDDLRLFNSQGDRVDAQLTVLSRWGGALNKKARAIKWVQVDFQADVAARKTLNLELRARAGASKQGGRDLLRRAGAAVLANTGALSFRVGASGFRLLENVQLDVDGNGEPETLRVASGHTGGVEIERLDGTVFRSSADGSVKVTIEQNGPLHGVIRVDGRHTSNTDNGRQLSNGRMPLPYLEFTARIHVYRGKSWVRVFYSVRNPERFLTTEHNQGGSRLYHEFERLSLVLPVMTGGATTRFTLGGETPAGVEYPNKGGAATGNRLYSGPLPAAASVGVFQDSSGGPKWGESNDGDRGVSFRGFRVDGAPGRGLQASGWADLSTTAWGVAFGMRHFWQNFPKGLRVAGDGTVSIDLWPAGSRQPHRLEGGRQKTHEILFDFHRGAHQGQSPSFAAFAEPLHGTVEPEWVAETLALGPIAAAQSGDSSTKRLTEIGDRVVNGPRGKDLWRERLADDIYGWRDWGDSYRAGNKDDRHFGNNEFDFGWSLLVQYLRQAKPDRAFLDAAESILRHLVDIDIYHSGKDAGVYSHGVRQHDNSDTDHSNEPLPSHYWVRGLLAWYVLTGDRAMLDAAEETALWLDAMISGNGELDFNSQTRSQAWPALALTELWEVTGKAKYLTLAKKLLKAEIISEQNLSGARYPCAALDWEGDRGERDKGNAAPWQNGYVSEALGRYAFARRHVKRPDLAAEQALFRVLDAITECGFATPTNGLFVPGDSDRDNIINGRRYQALVIDRIQADGSYSIIDAINQVLTDGYAYGALLSTSPTRRAAYLAMAEETWRWTMGPESAPGVPFSKFSYCCPQTPAKNAAIRLRFGQVYQWLRQQPDVAASAGR